VLEKRPEPDEALDCELRIGLGTAQRQCGDPAHRQTLLDAARQAITLDDTELLARAALANSRGSFSVAGGVDHERIEVLRAACRAVEGTRGATEAQLLAVLGTELSFAGTYGERQETSNRALAIARELGDPRTLLAVLNHRFTTIRVPPTLEERLSQAAEAAKLAALTDDPLLQLHAAADRYQTAWEAANRPEIERTWPILQEGAERLRQPFFDFLIRSHASHEAWVVGDLDESERLANEMLGSGKESGQPDAPTWFWVHLIEIRREQDRIEELIPTIESAALEFPKIPGIQLLLARCYCDVGRLDEARKVMIDHVAEDFSALGWDPTWLPSVGQGADAVADLGWPQAGEKLLPLIRPYCAQFATNMGFCSGPVARSVGRLLTTIGRMDEAERCFSASEKMSDSMRSPLFAAHTHLDWGKCLAATGGPQSRQRADEHLAQALELSKKHRLTYIARKAMSLRGSVESSRGDCAVDI
jgi:tetratricopeptide (TPR) repeat protein